MLGDYHEGAESSAPPNCATPALFGSGLLPTFGGVINLNETTPSMSPKLEPGIEERAESASEGQVAKAKAEWDARDARERQALQGTEQSPAKEARPTRCIVPTLTGHSVG
jgi:hypothetical protein